MISDTDSMRLVMPSENQVPRRDPEFKRKAWLAVFVGSALFWVVVALVIWQWWG
ncbi:YmiA family putative membrane protein [Salmonella enterica subsp. houtenae]|uniref:YmiA family putative membrane protein n=2 Tax=Salmonella enterica TaxID=28901 RepID=A0A5Y4Z5Y5_SALER|nr:YmiA family putative membrane protein [Salmonella enterica]EBP3984928.1 YmiA family putative membrane protein [Salmonella enterica subsp. enterica]EBX0545284.1 YmiA family putative membrane protein [Salmonella enterica subsp. houtenae serovar 44:z4,z23:-]ECE5933221.1 YmiA family putative membrane protein [Salmonella enterica subsp. houtenae]EDG3664868.1 YmiA family putative membrane protein [Salmonella enterica subsp. enterica serovar Give]